LGEEIFEREVLQRLTRIETKQENINNQCAPCRSKIDHLEIAVARVEAATKSAHHRLDAMQTNSAEVKEELITAIKDQISGIYRTAGMLGAISGFFVGVIMWLIK
jgi:tetrahydromethanopterin S-methyltransferase subunit G